jgi:hypothetical protein
VPNAFVERVADRQPRRDRDDLLARILEGQEEQPGVDLPITGSPVVK